MRKSIVMLLVLAMALGSVFAGGSGESGTAENDVRHITFVTPLIGHDSWLQARDGLFQAADDLGFEAEWVGPSDGNVDQMINFLEIAIAQDVDGIITQGQNPEAMVSVLEKAYEAGIPVCVIDSPIADAPQLGYIGFDLDAAAKLGVEAAYNHFGPDAYINAIFLTTNIDYSAATTSFDNYKKYLTEYYGDNYQIQQQETLGDSIKCMSAVETCILADNTINCIFCIDGIAAPAAYTVLEQYGLEDEVFIVGIDDTAEQIDMIKDGRLYGVTYGSFFKQAYQSCLWILDYLDNGTIPEYKFNDVGTMMIDASNVDSYKEQANDISSWTEFNPILSLYPDGVPERTEY